MNDEYYCGVHCRSKDRITLKKNPNAKLDAESRIKENFDMVLKVAELNRSKGMRGKLTVTKLKMMKPVDYVPGYYPIFPNFKHHNRKDGFGCKSLSPKSLGPVNHIMPNLPQALNLENFHQFSKHWQFEFDKDVLKHEYLEARRKGYLDPVPHRHKYERKVLEKYDKNINKPSCSIFYTKDGEERRYSYIGCRYFYCKVYEQLASKTKDYQQLVSWLKEGRNLQIVGYDGYPVIESDNMINTLLNCYFDESKPFGHELVLYTMLIIDEPANYPWNIIYAKNREMYENVGIEY